MIKFLKISVFSILLFISFTSKAQFDSTISLTGGLNALRIAVPFLTIAPDSRSAAFGDAGAATTPDANAQHWNPAKLAFIDKEWGVSFSYTPWLRNLVNDINLTYLAGYYRLDKEQVISGSLLYFSMGEITFTGTSSAEPIKFFNPNEFAIDFAYSRKFADLISGGIAFRYIRSDLTGGYSQQGQSSSKAGSTFAGDISIYYQQPLTIDGKKSQAAFGLNISNIGAKISYNDEATKDFIPINMRLGGRLTIDIDQYNSMSMIADANKLLVPTPPIYNTEGIIIEGKDPNVAVTEGMLQSFYDAPGGMKEELREISYALGVEYWYAKQFALRGGYFGEDKTKGNRKYFTIGAGLRYNIFNLDFAYLIPQAGQNNPMANTVRFTLSFDFEKANTRKTKK
ncbi:MAG: type IX secretion system outer membrane channel protein PorV [Tenuifilaceae bacterium]